MQSLLFMVKSLLDIRNDILRYFSDFFVFVCGKLLQQLVWKLKDHFVKLIFKRIYFLDGKIIKKPWN